MLVRKSQVKENTFTVLHLSKKMLTCKWTYAVQTHAVQGSSVPSKQAPPSNPIAGLSSSIWGV